MRRISTEIAKAYVQIIPSMKGVSGQLEKVFSSAGESSGRDFSSSFGAALKKGLSAVGIATLAKKAADFTKEIVGSYADYEQLTGGVETLFKASSDAVMKYAQNAYKTAGLSANQYMETVTSFSASLLQSLGGDTEAAAKVGDMAITDMADNANKMGTSIESIQNAYQGFAKSNYTMLDNLKLGYGGTKEEMQRLLSNAEAFSGVHYDISSLSDVYNAIHVVQTELGITGTTALEASETISGSASAMKSAWANLLTGMADENADFESLVGNFTTSLVTCVDNLVPRIGIAVDGVGSLLTSFSETVVPKLIEYITANLPQLIETGITLVVKLSEGLMNAIPKLVAAAPQIVKSIVTTVVGLLPELLNVGRQMVEGVWQGIKNAASWFTQQVKNFFKGIVDSVKNVLGIHSPSKVFAGIGGYMADGLSVGFSDEIGAVQREIAGGVDGMIGKISGASVSLNASVNSGAVSSGFDMSALDRLVNAARDTTAHIHVYLDSKEIRTGQQRLARAVG